jgi:hypothetical protein
VRWSFESPPSGKREKLERYLDEVIEPSLPVLPYDGPAAEGHAAERARLTRAGQTPAFVDGQIAAVAAVNRLTVVTLNVAHFRSFRGPRSGGDSQLVVAGGREGPSVPLQGQEPGYRSFARSTAHSPDRPFIR